MTEKIQSCLNPLSGLLLRNARTIIRLKYYHNFRRKINLSHPVLFHDKIFWLALNTDTRLWTELADKYAVRQFVAKKIGPQYLNEIFGVWDDPDDIFFSSLPNEFVLKTTHGSAGNIIVRDKTQINASEICHTLHHWLSLNYGALTGQPHYAAITPRVICERMLFQDPEDPGMLPVDYKFYCFGGKAEYCNIFANRKENSHDVTKMIFDMDWNAHPEAYDQGDVHYKKGNVNFPKPKAFDEMRLIAEKLSAGIPFVRVDLYCIADRPLFGEMTFTPGMDIYYTLNFQRHLGDLIKIDNLK